MGTVGVRELKNRRTRHLRRTEQGEESRHGPVATAN